ncbi:TIGR03364 family FAD-dependent oxidoreductase [Amycolatopsis suaedae]|uniref:TIGR03364 family FAD-dependent oxidoreductase n=1 Tax=Amycolatopsis suaedae TaxID=2510978 RepID=A0A4Q7J829_9PSEU|nr:TIGR03364 family FAD-dependent oxidoreductase [Amycolatopsis suaedae]RZQ63108.1 TIGR03364 family FAD-dependent oxidoreductase [Amycolatopsis suaedae]
MRILIVGGGVLGTMHAWTAVQRGHDVVQLEREPEARGASVRNFGLIWVGGRADGPELETALRARELWESIADEVPGLGFRANGSLTVLRTEAEWAVAEQTADGGRNLTLLDAAAVRERNPALRGEFLGALHCGLDAAVEPRTAQPALRERLAAKGRYRWLPGREVRSLTAQGVVDDRGESHDADLVLFCTGAWLGGLVGELTENLPVRRVRLQMAQTEPLGEPLPTSVADGDSLRYYPAYRGPALDAMNATQPQPEVAARHAMQLLMVQRRDGGLTVGDTHAYDEPFGFDVEEEPYDHLRTVAAALLGRPLPRIVRRWAGVYAQADGGSVVHRARLADNAWLVTGPGGRGMTCSPAIAERTADEAGL